MKRSPQENIAAVEAAKTQVLEHCMCLRFKETDEYYRVDYPEGSSWIGAVQAHYDTCGKLVALERMLAKMETHYQEGIEWSKRFGS